ncbi:MAG: hypothetical protein ACI8QZ_003575, partial [Chlamydiales bacterium]
MTEVHQTEDVDELISEGEAYSKDSLDLVCEQLCRRSLFRIGAAMLALLYAVAIYAPLIANDRPYRIEAVYLNEYTGAVRSLSAVTSSVVRLLGQSPQEYLEARGENAPVTWEAALSVEQAAAEERLQALRRALPEVHHARLDEYIRLLEGAAGAGRSGARDEALRLGEQARSLAREFRTELAVRTGADAHSGAEDAAGVS